MPMTPEERIARTEGNLEKLTDVTTTLAASVAAHDDQIELLIRAAELNRQEWE